MQSVRYNNSSVRKHSGGVGDASRPNKNHTSRRTSLPSSRKNPTTGRTKDRTSQRTNGSSPKSKDDTTKRSNSPTVCRTKDRTSRPMNTKATLN